MQTYINFFVHRLLNLMGLKTINSQFLFSYMLIFVLALMSTVTLYYSLESSADAINLAGRQRMLSQRLAKEALFVGQKAEDKAVVQKTIDLFEASHHRLMKGAAEDHFPAITDKMIIQQMDIVNSKWQPYKVSILNYIKAPNNKDLLEIKASSLMVLKNMHKAVGMMAKKANQKALNQLYIALSTSIAILILVFLGRQYGMRTLMMQFKLLKERLQYVSIGDFSRPLEIDSLAKDNEIGELYEAYNTMLVKVGALLEEVERCVEEVQLSATDVRTSSVETTSGVTEQEEEIEKISSSISEVSHAVSQVADTALNSAQSVDETKKEAELGFDIVQKSHNHANELLGQINDTATILNVLENDSQEVSQVLSVITSIAEQTNLLALNAAIEAARAGEQGRGFAVVADEVRTLAQRTQESTGEIRRIIESLQSQSNKAVKAMESSQVMVKETVDENSKATKILATISQSVAQVSDKMNYIANSSKAQSLSAEKVDSATLSMSNVAQQTSTSAQLLIKASDDINVQMVNLEEMIHKFKHQ
ncbi:MAG: methyl-accepting chemotaxis protein [Gammaproteobacteria bacterium]|nr:methyl-accepting chemotaxis protein [Gammaproteobacteria bacterium]